MEIESRQLSSENDKRIEIRSWLRLRPRRGDIRSLRWQKREKSDDSSWVRESVMMNEDVEKLVQSSE